MENNPPPETKDMCLMQTAPSDNNTNHQQFLVNMSLVCGIDHREVRCCYSTVTIVLHQQFLVNMSLVCGIDHREVRYCYSAVTVEC